MSTISTDIQVLGDGKKIRGSEEKAISISPVQKWQKRNQKHETEKANLTYNEADWCLIENWQLRNFKKALST